MKLKDAYQALLEIHTPLADIKLLFEEYFKVNFNDVFCATNTEIDDEQFNKVLFRLKDDYPILYLIGYLDVLNVRIYLNENVLIPEVETEEFIYDYIFNNLELNNKKVLDLCTGSGFIALALKKHYVSADVIASDISLKALQIAKKSAAFNKLDIQFIHSDYFQNINSKFDVIISNPPYIPLNSPYLKAKFSPELALFAGVDGLDSYRTIFKDVDKYLNSNGIACFELESPNAEKITDLFLKNNPNYETSIYFDMNKRARYLIAHKIRNRQA